MASVQITKSAAQDLKEIFKFISRKSYQNAEMVIRTIRQEISTLDKHPQTGKIVREINNPSFREIKVFKYSVIYMHVFENVSVLTIHHSSRLLSNNPHLKDFFE
jgi:addiction module RelE/StbE family toxin